jgi:hypothetical protein
MQKIKYNDENLELAKKLANNMKPEQVQQIAQAEISLFDDIENTNILIIKGAEFHRVWSD